MSAAVPERQLLRLAAKVVAAHVSHNATLAAELPDLIRVTYDALSKLGAQESGPDRPTPAVPIKESVLSDRIICLEDGRPMKLLKRYLLNTYGMTPAQYRVRWSLPDSYPMVAPAYAQYRSFLAKRVGLGRKPHGDDVASVKIRKFAEGVSGKPGIEGKATIELFEDYGGDVMPS